MSTSKKTKDADTTHELKRRGRPPTGSALETSLSNVRFSTDLQALLKACATAKGCSYSQFGREAVEQYCRKVREGRIVKSTMTAVDSRNRGLHLKPLGGGIEILHSHRQEAKICAQLLNLSYSAFIRRALFEHCAANINALQRVVQASKKSGRGLFLN